MKGIRSTAHQTNLCFENILVLLFIIGTKNNSHTLIYYLQFHYLSIPISKKNVGP